MGFQQNPQPPSEVQGQVSPQTKQHEEPEVVDTTSENLRGPESDMSVEEIQLPAKFTEHFSKEVILGFMQQAELAVQSQNEPVAVATMMSAAPYADGARTLVQHFTPTDIVEAVRAIPGSETSPLLRQDGKKWLERLWKELSELLVPKTP